MLVGQAWAPGYGKTPAPGTQKQAGALVEAWVKTGAACPANQGRVSVPPFLLRGLSYMRESLRERASADEHFNRNMTW